MKEKLSEKLIQRGERSPELGGGESKDTKRHQRSTGWESTDYIVVTSLPQASFPPGHSQSRQADEG